jgi:hypothetical protein
MLTRTKLRAPIVDACEANPRRAHVSSRWFPAVRVAAWLPMAARLGASFGASACGTHLGATSADSGTVTPGDGASVVPDGSHPWQGLPGERLGPLAASQNARTSTFMTSDECASCHAAGSSPTVLRDGKQRDVSPFRAWRSSMMALSARDPYYLAVLEHELAAHPGAESSVMQTCTRCHAPAANVELAAAGQSLDFRQLTAGTSNEATVGRDGVTCSLCHQIQDTGLGTAASFTGRFAVGSDRRIFGPHAAPFTMPMQMRVGYTPVAAAHMLDSGLCGSCHTVVTRSLAADGTPAGPEFLEQGPFVEWSVSSFAKAGGATCQDCHLPSKDDDGVPIATVLSTTPPGRLAPRSPFGRHLFAGANAMMLRVLASERVWAGFDPAPGDLLAQAERAETMLRSAARVVIVDSTHEGNGIAVRIRVDNLSGHKLPTGYPSRRMWLHVRILDQVGDVVFESGADHGGRIIGADGEVLDHRAAPLPHRREITGPSEVQVWEAVPSDSLGRVAANLLDATGYLKDNRLLPIGFDATDPRALLAQPAGTAGDDDFGSSDDVIVRLAEAPQQGRIEVRLLYQTARPAELELLAEHPGPAARRFLDMMGPMAMRPIVLAATSAPLR